MQGKIIAECRMLQGEHSAILSTFINLPFVFKIFVLFIFEWLFYTGFTVSMTWLVHNILHQLENCEDHPDFFTILLNQCPAEYFYLS